MAGRSVTAREDAGIIDDEPVKLTEA